MSDPLITGLVLVPASVAASVSVQPSDAVMVSLITVPSTILAIVLTWWNNRITAKAQAVAATAQIAAVQHTVNSQLSTALALVETKTRLLKAKDSELAGLRETIAMAAKTQTITETAPALVAEPPRRKRVRKKPTR